VKKTILLLAVLLTCFVTSLASGAKPAAAQTRNVYGYINDTGSGELNDVNQVVITDVTPGSNYYKTWSASFGWSNWGLIQYWQHDLPLGDSFYVDVYGHDRDLCWCGFYLSAGWGNYKIRDMAF